jgi:HEPN domain-containing protein
MSAASDLGVQWVRNAGEQLELARVALSRSMWNAAVGLAAAAVERYLKAALVADNTQFPYSHDIDKLCRLQSPDLEDAYAGSLSVVVRARLTDGSTKARYPGGRAYARDDAEECVEAAEATRRTLAQLRPSLWPELIDSGSDQASRASTDSPDEG